MTKIRHQRQQRGTKEPLRDCRHHHHKNSRNHAKHSHHREDHTTRTHCRPLVAIIRFAIIYLSILTNNDDEAAVVAFGFSGRSSSMGDGTKKATSSRSSSLWAFPPRISVLGGNNTPNNTTHESTATASSSPPLSYELPLQPSHKLFQAPNPLTGRPIQLSPYLTSSSFTRTSTSKSTTTTIWQGLLQKGGWMIHKGQICSIMVAQQDHSIAPKKDQPPSEEQVATTSTAVNNHPSWPDWYVLEPPTLIEPTREERETILPTLPHPLPLYRDILWLYKPDGLLTLPGKTEPDSLATRVLNSTLFMFRRDDSTSHKGSRSSSNGKSGWTPRPVHRLDRDTSGIIVMAKTKAAFTALSQQFEQRKVEKQYVALVDGIVVVGGPDDDHGRIDRPIGKRPTKHGYKVWTTQEEGAEQFRSASTHYQVSRRYHQQNYTRMILKPQTGRGHQLRLHMTEVLGHAILGDTLHPSTAAAGEASTTTPPRLCLHAEYLQVWVRRDDEDGDKIFKAKCWCLPPF